jgi:hypothetical protein
MEVVKPVSPCCGCCEDFAVGAIDGRTIRLGPLVKSDFAILFSTPTATDQNA